MSEQAIRRISSVKEWRVYTAQYIRILFSDKKNLAVSLLFPVLALLIEVWIAGKNMFVNYEGTKSACFVLVSAAIWGGLFNSIQTVVRERANVKRDYVTGLRFRCYTFSRAVVQQFLCLIQSAILTLSFICVSQYYGNDMPDSGILIGNALPEYFISLFLLMYSADMMGLMISCIVKKTETANVLAPYILIVQLIFSGILFDMEGAAEKVSYLMISRWGMEALGSISDLNELPLKIQETVPTVPHEALDMFDYTDEHLIMVWGIMLAFIVVFALIGNILLHRVSKDTR